MQDDHGILAGRYQLVRRLGSGASSDVYEAIDLALGSRVALKRFRDDSIDALVSLKQEFRALANIHAPGLVRFYDLVVEGDVAFFTMELVHGVTLTEYAQQASPAATRAALGQLANAIAELHAVGQLHRDLKPANILVTADGGVRVLDFGLATAHGPTAGTPVYMAPELFLGGAPSPASDWYSYGAVLYELFAGSVPAKGRDIAELLLRKQWRRFPPARELNPGTPPELCDLSWGLLEPDPVKRLGRSALAVALGLDSEREGTGRARVELFGRTAERAELAAGLAEARAGRPTVVVVEGESGAGKSSLVRSFLAAECATGCFVLTSAARPQESVPLRALDAIVDELASVIARLPAADRAAIERRVAPELVRAFPVLGMLNVAMATDDRPGTGGSEVRREAQLAFADVLRRLAEIQPVVLWIDDLQWADYESLLFLDAAVSHAGAERLLVVLGRRPPPAIDSLRSSSALSWPDREAHLAGFRKIAIGPLDEAAARALLGAHTARPMSDAQIARMMREAAGNAFLLEFLARHERERERSEALDERDAQAASGGIGAALRQALDGLAHDARILFECVSLAQRAVPRAWLGHVLADRAELRDHLARLSAKGLISVDERDHVRPYHDALREPAEAALDAAIRSARHASLAEAFAASSAPVEWQIPHLEGSGQHAAAAAASIAAGRVAAERYAYEIAAAYFEKALATELAPATRAEVLAALSGNLAAAGNGRAAALRYEQAAEVYRSTSDPRTALAMHHRGAIALLRSGEIEAGRAALTRALRGLGEQLPRMPLVAFFYEALRLALRSRTPAHRPLPPRIEMRLDTLWTSATTLSMYDPAVANPLTLRFVRRALAAGEPRWVVRALALEAAFLSALGGRFRARAERTMAELRARAAEVARPYENAWVAATEGSTAWLSGDVRRCREWTTRARELFRAVPETGAYELALLDAFRLPALALLGHHDAALRGAEDVLAAARARGDGFATLPCLHGHITLAYLGAEQPDRAAARIDEAAEIARQASSPMPAYHQTWSRATLALFRKGGAEAYRGIVGAWRPLQRSGMLRFEAVAGDLRYLRARCALAAARMQRGVRGRRLWDAASQARWLRRSTLAFGPATADAIEAQIAELCQRPRDAQALAASASARLHELGLVHDAEAVDRWASGRASVAIDHVYVG